MRNIKFIHLEACNFVDYPPGGTLSFARQMLKSFGNSIALAGIVNDDTICGKWTKKKINGIDFNFFGIGRIKPNTSKPIIPERLQTYLLFKRQLNNLKSLGVDKIFTRTPQFVLSLDQSDWKSICFFFAGTANSVAISRYPFLRWVAPIYEKYLFKSLRNNANCILAAADEKAIEMTIQRSKGILEPKSIKTFPTRFDANIFHPKNQNDCRQKLGLSVNDTIIVTNGRLCWVKGYEFIIQTFQAYSQTNPSARLIFIGDGEDRDRIESDYSDLIDSELIRITGHIPPEDVSTYLGAADLMMVGSFEEGWSTAMVEALACAKPIITTNISGAKEMVFKDKNGEILKNRDPQKAANAISRVLRLKCPGKKSYTLSKAYRLDSLAQDLEEIWLKSN